MIYISNAFSLNMFESPEGTYRVARVEEGEVPKGTAISAVGHADLARSIGVEFARRSLALRKGDVLYVAQYKGPRLPEGATTLPEGSQVEWFKVVAE